MKFFPELEEVKKIAADGKYRVLPVSCEMLSDFTTPIETMKILKKCFYPLLHAGVSHGK